MRLQDYPEKDGKQVWLSSDEMDHLVEESEDILQKMAFLLGGRVGLRRSEIVRVQYQDFEHADDGFVRVWNDYAKRGKYREPPIPDDLQTMVETKAYDADPTDAVVDVDGTTVYRWVQRAAARLQDETGDEGWSYLDVHDLRRSWGSHLLWDQEVLPSVVMRWGGWSDWETFRDHYLGEMSPEAARRERAKISYMGRTDVEADATDPDAVFQPRGSDAQSADPRGGR